MYHPEVARHLNNVFKKSQAVNPDCIGYHGTSLEAVKYILNMRVLPGSCIRTDEEGFGPPDWLYFSPTVEGLLKNGQSYEPNTTDEAKKEANAYAEQSARVHRFLSLLDLPSEDPIIRTSSLELALWGYEKGDYESDKAMVDLLKSSPTLDIKAVKVAISQVHYREPRGFVLGLDRSCLESEDVREIAMGDDAYELKILIPDGLNYKHICRIEPLGSEERRFLNDLPFIYNRFELVKRALAAAVYPMFLGIPSKYPD